MQAQPELGRVLDCGGYRRKREHSLASDETVRFANIKVDVGGSSLRRSGG